jgi:ATP-binding cassette subfamily B protein
VLLRVLEPLSGRDDAEPRPTSTAAPTPVRRERPAGVELQFRDAAVGVAEQPILSGLNLRVAAGEHVAVVGPSGAGKSTLAGVLLGWHTVTAGAVALDGAPMDAEAVAELRRRTAWVDPTLQIWDRSLIENLACGRSSLTPMEVESVIADAGLIAVVERLPEQLDTCLGYNGSQLSAGEAQRVRLGRAFLVPSPSLVVLDEPLRGLEGEQRRRLIARLRMRWAQSTLLYITHDLAEAGLFDRVLVIDGGRVVEDASPQELLRVPASRFRRLLDAQQSLRARWSGSDWEKLALDEGRVAARRADSPVEQSA